MNDRMRRIHRIHFVGIGGAGMGGIAEVLLNLGYAVQGSDLKPNEVTQRLQRQGAQIMLGHAREHVGAADVVVVSTAIAADNPEVIEASARRLPIVQRAEMLGELMRFRYAIAIAGTHGKTTTTSMVASLLAEGGLDPTFVIGGRLVSADSNARLGQGKYLVAEADESDASFMHLQPMIAILTNIDNDHLGTHQGDFERLKQSFVDFLHNLPFYGLAVICSDDPVAASILPRINRPIITYGIHSAADVRATNIDRAGRLTGYEVQRAGAVGREDPRLHARGAEARGEREAAGGRALDPRVHRGEAAHARLPAGGDAARRPHPRRQERSLGARREPGRQLQERRRAARDLRAGAGAQA